MGTVINMDESDYIAMRDKLATAYAETAAAKALLAAERERGFDERLADMSKFVRASKDVVDFAVANLSPEWCRGWPHESLETMIELVDKIGNPTSNDQERTIIWRQFHESIVDYDRRWSMAAMSTPKVAAPEEDDDDDEPERPAEPVVSAWKMNLMVIAAIVLLLVLGTGLGLMLAGTFGG